MIPSLVATPRLIIIDNFYDNPEDVRRWALGSEVEQHTPTMNSPYSFKRIRVPDFLAVRAVDRIGRWIGTDLSPKFIASQIVVETAFDQRETKRRTWVHFDRWRWVGVLYLNLPHQCAGGTSFYRHAVTGLDHWLQVLRSPRRKSIERQLARDTCDLSKWELTDSIGMKLNRLVLFDGRTFHQATKYFGGSITQGRMFQQFSFNPLNDREERQ